MISFTLHVILLLLLLLHVIHNGNVEGNAFVPGGLISLNNIPEGLSSMCVFGSTIRTRLKYYAINDLIDL